MGHGLKIIGLLILGSLLLVGNPAGAAPNSLALLPQGPSSHDLALHMEILQGQVENLDLAQVLKEPWRQRFHPLPGKELRAPSQDLKVHWLRFTLRATPSPTPANPTWLLAIDYVYLAKIDFYAPTPEGWRVVKTGLERPFGQRELPYRGFVFTLPPAGSEPVTCYLRLETIGIRPLRFSVISLSELLRKVALEDFLLSICLGILAGMILFNMLLALSLRDRVYVYYVGYITFALLSLICLNGQINAFWDLGLDWFIKLTWTCMGLFTSFAYLFMRGALNTKNLTPLLDKFLVVGGFYGLAIVAAGLLGQTWIARWLTLGSGFFSPLLAFSAGIFSLRRGYAPALYFLFAWGVLAVAVATAGLYEMGVVYGYIWTKNALLIGTASESVLLSLGLAARIRNLDQEKKVLVESEKNLKILSYTDGLTGLYNKRFFAGRMQELLAASQTQEKRPSLLFMDLDDFKQLNDTWGHDKGDQVLKCLAQVIIDSVRADDMPCRWGGEEFAVIFPGVGLERAASIAERIRRRFEETKCAGLEVGFKKSISLGLAQAHPGEGKESLVHRADQALYQAKNTGKNRLCLGR